MGENRYTHTVTARRTDGIVVKLTTVTLSEQDQMTCAMLGAGRRVRAIRKQRSHPDGAPDDRDTYQKWGQEIEGVAAEMAVAKHCGVFYSPGLDTDHYTGDVNGWEVRHTILPHGGLLIKPSESESTTFVLVTGEIPTLTIVGWCTGADGRSPEHWNEKLPRPCYLVQQKYLKPIDELIRQ